MRKAPNEDFISEVSLINEITPGVVSFLSALFIGSFPRCFLLVVETLVLTERIYIITTNKGDTMKLSRWTLFQIITISFLLAAGYALSYYRENISNQIVNNVPITLIISLSIIFGAVVCTSLLFYFQTKKSSTFLIHPLWKKMHVLVGINILVSMILVIFPVCFQPDV